MSTFARDLLNRAREQEKGAQQLFDGSFPDTRDKEQAAAIVAKVTANIYRVLGEFLEYTHASEAQSETEARRAARQERFDAIRRAHVNAVSTGDWTEYDKLAFGGGASAAGSEGGTGNS